MHRPRTTRLPLVPALALAALVPLAACSSDDEATPATSEPTAATSATATTGTDEEPTTTVPLDLEAAPPEDTSGDQTAPTGTNGLAVDAAGTLWVADGQGNQVLAVDLATGEILRRFPAPTGAWPDDLAVDEAGRVFWTGFEGGQVGRIDPATGEHVLVADVGAGANPVTVAEDGNLLVGRAVTADGLFAVDPDGATEPGELAAELGNVNGFDVAADGVLYGPRAAGEVVAVDPATGDVTGTVVTGLGYPASVREAPESTAEAVVLLVLTVTPSPTVSTVDVTSGTVEELFAVGTPAADNLVALADGTIVVSTFASPDLVVRSPDGTLRTLTLGG